MEKFDFAFAIVKVLFFSGVTSTLSLFFAPALIKFLNKIKFWKKRARENAISGEKATVFYSLHKEREISVPRGGGLLIWISVFFVIILTFVLAKITGIWWMKKLNFLSRKETWLPLFTLVSASIIGLIDDALVVYGKGKYLGGGLSFWRRFLIISLIGLIGGSWFYFKLGWSQIHIPLFFNFPAGINVDIGPLIIPFFIIVTLACWAGGIVDGLDGLAGGVFASIFGAFSILAFSQGKIDLATFCGAIVGALFAFLWYNIPPARFYMGETGVMGLTVTMAVVSFLTDFCFGFANNWGNFSNRGWFCDFATFIKKIKKKENLVVHSNPSSFRGERLAALSNSDEVLGFVCCFCNFGSCDSTFKITIYGGLTIYGGPTSIIK
jgi:phospho-N-acetylmuramoyl-pentapeptide-transferase